MCTAISAVTGVNYKWSGYSLFHYLACIMVECHTLPDTRKHTHTLSVILKGHIFYEKTTTLIMFS